MKSLLTKLSKVKSEIGKISKDSTNPFFKSKYFDVNALLEHVEPLLQSNGLLLLQPIKNGVVHSEIYDIETADFVSSGMVLPEITDPQKVGSAVTYYRRYTLQSLLGLQAEDDDANKASGNTSLKKPNIVQIPEKELERITEELSNISDLEGLKTLKAKEISSINRYPQVKALFNSKYQKITAA